MGSWVNPTELFLISVTEGPGMSYPVCVMVHTKISLAAVKNSPCSGGQGSLSWQIGSLVYVRCHITVNVLRRLLNKTFPSFHL